MRREVKYDSIEALYDDSAAGEGLHYGVHDFKPSFVGCNRDDVEKRKYSYSEGVDMLDALPSVEVSGGGRERAYRWDDSDGDEMDMDRLHDGMPCLRKRVNVGGGRRGPRFATLLVNLTVSSHTRYKDMLWMTWAATRLVDELERSGTRVRVEAVLNAGDAYRNGDDVLIRVTVKREDEPVNVALLATALSPWMMRYHMINCVHLTGDRNKIETRGSCGRPVDIRRDSWLAEEFGGSSVAYVLDSEEVLSERSAAEWLGRCAERPDAGADA